MRIINFYEGHIYGCLYFLAVGPFPGPDRNLYLPAPAPNLYLLAFAYNFITSSSLSLQIPTMSPQFVSVFMALAYNLYYRSGLINNPSICMPILVN